MGKHKTTEQLLREFPLEYLKTVYLATVNGEWDKVDEGGEMNKKNIINSLLNEPIFDESFRDKYTTNGVYEGLSLGKYTTTEDSVYEYVKNFFENHPYISMYELGGNINNFNYTIGGL